MDLLCFCSVLCLLCLCARLFICALWSPAGKWLTSWLSFVVSNCEFVTFLLASLVRCGTLLYRFLIFAPLLTFKMTHERSSRCKCIRKPSLIVIIAYSHFVTRKLWENASKSSFLYYYNGAQKHEGFVGFEKACFRAKTYVILTSLNYIHFYTRYY